MAEQSLLAIVREECKRLNLNVPGTVTGSQNEDVLQMWALMNEGIEELASEDWEQMSQSITFLHAGLAGNVALDLGADYPDWRRLVQDTLWNRTAQQRVTGPLSPLQWQQLITFNVAPSLFSFRMQGHRILIFPTPADLTATTFALEYRSKYGVTTPSADGMTLTNEENYSSDQSYPRIPTRVIKADLKWRWRQAKGLAYAEDRAMADAIKREEFGGEPAEVLTLDNEVYTGPAILIPAGTWPVT